MRPSEEMREEMRAKAAKHERKDVRVSRLLWVLAIVSGIAMIIDLIEQFQTLS
jgi:hypothetical protein